jgi:hypothetical protein
MNMNINITVIPHNEQRYNTVGDWQFDDHGNLTIKVSNLKDDKMNYLIAIHELIEAFLCRYNQPEITGREVDEFDFAFESNNDFSEAGDDPRAPYHIQHRFASAIEILLAVALGVNWKEYEERINSL